MTTRPALALFDLDHTLLDGYSDVSWAQFLIEEGVLHPEEYHAKNMWFAERYNMTPAQASGFLSKNNWHRIRALIHLEFKTYRNQVRAEIMASLESTE